MSSSNVYPRNFEEVIAEIECVLSRNVEESAILGKHYIPERMPEPTKRFHSEKGV